MSDAPPQAVDTRTKLERWVRAQEDTVAEVARRMGCGRVALHRYMARRAMPRPDRLRVIEQLSGGEVTAADMVADFQRAKN